MNCLRMTKFTFFLLGFLLVVGSVSGQSIVYRNNCLDACNSKTNTVLEVKSITPFSTGTTFTWTINSQAYAPQTNISSLKHEFTSKGTFNASVVINSSGAITVLNTLVYIGGISSEIYLNDNQTDTLKELCSGTSPNTVTLAVPSAYNNTNHSFRWFPNGESLSQITVEKEGCYSVKIFENGDLSNCYIEAKSKVKICGSYPNKPLVPTGIGGSSPLNCVNCPQWDLGNNVKVIFPTDGRPPYSATGPYIAPSNVAYYSINNKGANYLIGGLNSNGKEIYDNQNNKIGDVIEGNVNISNGVAIIPKKQCKGCNSIYYLITTSMVGGENRLFYHTIDLSSKNGHGDLIDKDKLLLNYAVSQKISVIATSKGYDLYALSKNSEKLIKFSVDETGISKESITTINSPIVGAELGNMNVSKDNSKIAIALPPGKVKVMDVGNNSTIIDIPISGGEVNGVCFSPDARLLYVSVNKPMGGSDVLQFLLDTTNVIGSNKHIMSTAGKIGAIQLDPARGTKLYATRNGGTQFFSIDKPNTRIYNTGTATNAGLNDLDPLILPAGLGLGLPNNVTSNNQDGGPPSLSMECKGLSYSFKMDKDLCEKNKNSSVKWELYYFGKNYVKMLKDVLNNNGQKEVNNAAAISMTTLGSSIIDINSTSNYDFNLDPTKSGYYVLVAKVTNNCVTDYVLDAQVFFIQILRPFKLKNQIDIIRSANFGNSPSCNFPNYTITPIPVLSTSTPVPTVPPNDLLVPGDFPISYNWSNNTTTPSLTISFPSGAGNYTLEIKDPATGCSDKSSTLVKFYTENDLPPQNNWNICMDDPFPLKKLDIFPDAQNLGFVWTTISPESITDPTPNLTPPYFTRNFIKINKDGDYTVRITDNYHCSLEREFNVKDLCNSKVIAPTVFRPNLNGVKPVTFYPQWNWPTKDFLDKPTYIPNTFRTYKKNRTVIKSLKVFNRWGILIFQKDYDPNEFKSSTFEIQLPSNGWDGTYQGKLVPQDTYAWVIEYESLDFPAMGLMKENGAVLVVY